MKKARSITTYLLILITMLGCQVNNIHQENSIGVFGESKALLLKDRVLVPLPEQYEKILLDEYAMIITSSSYSVVYRWIDQAEIEFIGSKKSPYNFFKSVFNNPSSDMEKRFLEGVNSKITKPELASELEFYYFDNKDGRQLYILSSVLDFVVEVTYKGKYVDYTDSVVNNSKLQ